MGSSSAVSAMSAGDLPEVWAGFAKRGMGVGRRFAAINLDVSGRSRRKLHGSERRSSGLAAYKS